MTSKIINKLLTLRVELIQLRKELPEFTPERASMTFAIENITTAIAVLERGA